MKKIIDMFLETLNSAGTKKLYYNDIYEFYQGKIPSSVEDLQAQTTTAKILEWKKFLEESHRNDGEGYKTLTINRKLSAIRAFTNYMQKMDILPKDPAKKNLVPNIRCDQWSPTGYLSTEAINAILLNIEKSEKNQLVLYRDKAIIILGFCCLLSRSEISNINTDDIVTSGNFKLLTLRGASDKLNEVIELPISVIELLQTYLRFKDKIIVEQQKKGGRIPLFVSLSNRSYQSRISENYINKMFKDRAKQANILIPVHFQILRHSGIKYLLESGESPIVVQRLARIKDINILSSYMNSVSIQEIAIRSAVEKLSDAIMGP